MANERVTCKYTHPKPFRVVAEDGSRQMVYQGDTVKVTRSTLDNMPERFEVVQGAQTAQKSSSSSAQSSANTSG